MNQGDRVMLLTARNRVRLSLAATVIALSGLTGSPGAQGLPPDIKPKLPPQLPSLTNTSQTVTIPRLDLGQTLTQSFTPNPSPAAAPAIMTLSGEWPIAIVSGGEGQVNRKIRAVLRSPFGQTVATGCGYSKNAQPTAVSSTTTPALLATGQFQPAAQDAVGTWNVIVSYCDNLPSGTSGASRVLGEIKIFVSYRAATS
jgi:hypothetical protein